MHAATSARRTQRNRWIARSLGALAGAIACALVAAASAHAQVDVSESFDSDLGSFDTVFGTQSDGFDVGWSETSNAGGAVGELGGRFVRVNQPAGDLAMPRVLDTASFVTPVDLNQSFHASGWMFLADESDDAGLDVHIGFYKESNPTNERVILRILPDGSDVWRFRMAVNGNSGERVEAPTSFDSTPLSWSFDWTPSGANDGTGVAVGSVSDGVTTLVLPTPFVLANAATVDSFGVWANSASTTDLTRTQLMYFDDLVYRAPEPGGAWLGATAISVALQLRRRRR